MIFCLQTIKVHVHFSSTSTNATDCKIKQSQDVKVKLTSMYPVQYSPPFFHGTFA